MRACDFLPFALLILAFPLHAQTRPAFTLGKDTTLITEPVHPDGTVNYLPALNALLSQGVTPDNNAAPLLLQLTSSKKPDESDAAYFTALQLPPPDPASRPRVIDYATFLAEKNHTDLLTQSTDEFLRIYAIEHDLMEHPWTAADQPDAAAWL